MRKLVLFIVSFFVYLGIQAQCPTGSVIIYTQTSVDDFATNYPNCTEISGNLKIGHWTTNAPITDLNGLNQLTSVGGNLIIEHDSLINLTGLENLTTIEGDMEVRFTRTLVNLSGIENLTTIGGDLVVGWPPGEHYSKYNFSLIDLTGLNSLTKFLYTFRLVH